jgi:hypothetical protein
VVLFREDLAALAKLKKINFDSALAKAHWMIDLFICFG